MIAELDNTISFYYQNRYKTTYESILLPDPAEKRERH